MKLSLPARRRLAAGALLALIWPLTVSAAPPKQRRSVQPRPSGSSSLLLGDLTINMPEFDGNLKTGDFVIPGTITGHSTDGDFRADRAYGNEKRNEITLAGHVVAHRLGGVGKVGQPQEPVTLTCDQLKIENRVKLYTASGNVKVVQGNKTLTAPLMRLDDKSHQAELTGGVHAEQPPDRSFGAAQVFYNTRSEDFKAQGGVQATFPVARPTP